MIKFGPGGWRAIIGDGFTKENIQILSKALLDKMTEEGVTGDGMVIGYDNRFLSKEAMRWAACVFAKEGVKVYLVNKAAPTPLIMYYVMKHDMHYGMMVTASHNPAVYNGIKVFTYGGRDADEIQTAQIEEYINNVTDIPVAEMDYEEGVKSGIIEEIYPLNDYIDAILASVDVDKIKNAGLRVALDPMYGVSKTSLETILMTARCEIETIHERHDTLFGGKLPAPNEERLRDLKNRVMSYNFDLGIATDGDADRIGVIDDKGNFLHPNDILVVLYYYLVKYKGWKGDCVRNICTTHLLDSIAKSFGQECHEVPVGFKYISAKMNQTDAIIGGESSGGMAVKGHIKGKDGIYAAALLVEMLAVTGMKLSDIMDHIRKEYGAMALCERDYRFSQEKKEQIRKLLLEDKNLPHIDYEIEKISYLDGLKIYLKDGGWISVRFSGTEPLLRIFCEMKEEREAAKFCETFENYLGLCAH
ncbi:MAG: phosphoglucomutase/phosphomannomutase family protein [Lachnospiraceae bacterium]|nr:phosphoglucomutase/phosphomannomutase family protein [Lachnospiraceae bacterium]